MTPRQVRRERREAERKAKKAEIKRAKAAGFVSQTALLEPALPAREARVLQHVPEPKTRIEEFVRQNRLQSGLVSQTAPQVTRRAEINRANSLRSTGPVTSKGKLASSRNSLKHGLASGEIIIPGEDPAAFEALLNALIDQHQPANPTEELLVKEIAQSYWLEQRAIRLQNECFTPEGVDERRLALFLRYQTTHNRAFHKALDTLFRHKQNRARQQAVGFVSQTASTTTPENQSVRQNAPSVRPNRHDETAFLSAAKTPGNDEPAFLSEAKTPGNAFVWQKAACPHIAAALHPPVTGNVYTPIYAQR